MLEPSKKRTIAFIDGQNLFYAVKQAFGYSYPNYDPSALARKVCERNNWSLEGIYFYTGVLIWDWHPKMLEGTFK